VKVAAILARIGLDAVEEVYLLCEITRLRLRTMRKGPRLGRCLR
jgi:hypothetical protein